LKRWFLQTKAKGATVWQHRNRAKATLWKSVRVQVAEAVGAQQPPGKTTIEPTESAAIGHGKLPKQVFCCQGRFAALKLGYRLGI
jgi:hypothetical protein